MTGILILLILGFAAAICGFPIWVAAGFFLCAAGRSVYVK